MFKNLGLSVYVSVFARQKAMLEKLAGKETLIFSSFHIQEEFGQDYVSSAKAMCRWLKLAGFRIIGDVSPKTLQIFGCQDIAEAAGNLELDILRLDYGFELDEILAVSRQYPIAFNASTVDTATAKAIVETGGEVYGMHNFYPRPETGLDGLQFAEINQQLSQLGVKVLAFIPGDEAKRGPIHEGLPTLEKHRRIPPYVAFLDMAVNFGIDGIFAGDVQLSERQLQLVQDYCQTGVTAIPAQLAPEYDYLLNQVFTLRQDSPLLIKRFQESREYSCPGNEIEASNCVARPPGSITMDNLLYGRYSGEIQVLGKSLPQDDRVNVIGKVAAEYTEILNCLPNGRKVRLIEP